MHFNISIFHQRLAVVREIHSIFQFGQPGQPLIDSIDRFRDVDAKSCCPSANTQARGARDREPRCRAPHSLAIQVG